MLHATVLLTALLAQTVYTWTDAQGEEHYTDDPTSIPKGVKANTLAQGEVETVRTAPQARVTDAGVSVHTDDNVQRAPKKVDGKDAGAPQDSCAAARAQLAQAEALLAEAKKQAAAPPAQDCQSALNTFGQAAYARCMASRQEQGDSARAQATAQHLLDDAKDGLRRAQVAGCR